MTFNKLFLAIAAMVLSLAFSPSAFADATIGQPAPAFTAKTLDGKDFDVSSLKGRVAIIYIWTTWCRACQHELPSLEAVYRQYHSQGLDVLAVSADLPSARADVDQVLRYFSLPATVSDAVSKNDFGKIESVPVTYIVDKSGNVVDIVSPATGALTEAWLSERIKALLEEKLETPKKDKEKPEGDKGE